ncbi:hypothetical protein [Pseudomonas phage pPA-3099-2aT.2]|uniref:Uncharacterized protein n=1 Tax=Pseudomonas phage pPA-3099-2aT.2 TaxID=3003808 RepID=A0AAF0AU46_9CAUD|nr:hypothetical protein QE325_gp134 [Pseudomonas phage pPA-3099-2aT.2]WBQ35247.1 hypothetical protein [Pseudomonas phage pPA-3099-2aT.2]
MFDFIITTSEACADSHFTSASLYDEDGLVLGSVLFFAGSEMTLTSGEVVIPFSGKRTAVNVYSHGDTFMRSNGNEAMFDSAGNITDIRW